MKFQTLIGAILLSLISLFLVISLFLPSRLYVERSIVVEAPIDSIYIEFHDLKNWSHWSPFTEDDPNVELWYDSLSCGVGSSFKWKSIEHGSGMIKIITSITNSLIIVEMFSTDYKTVIGVIDFKVVENSTHLTCVLTTEELSYPFGRYQGIFIEQMLRLSVDKALENLKLKTENIILTDN